jgi:hypothetical protein
MIEKIQLEDGGTLTVILCDSGSCDQGVEGLFPLGSGVWEPVKEKTFTVLSNGTSPEELGWKEKDWGWQCPNCTLIEKSLLEAEGLIYCGASLPESEE